MDAVSQATGVVAVGYLATLFVNFQAGVGPDSPYSLGWFNSSIGNTSAKYPSPITPAGYTFSIWSLIYLWNLAWIIYVITTLFRQNSRGPVYLNPPATSVPFLAAFFLNNVTNVAWCFVWDRELLTPAAVVLLASALTLFVSLYVSVNRVYEYLADFEEYASADLWAYRVLVHNGIALYAAWCTVATLVNTSVSLIYDAGVDSDTASYICLSILTAELLIYFALDCSPIFFPYTRYVIMVYPVIAWALAGVLVANSDDLNSPLSILTAVILSLDAVFLVVRIILIFTGESVPSNVKTNLKKAYGPTSYSPMV